MTLQQNDLSKMTELTEENRICITIMNFDRHTRLNHALDRSTLEDAIGESSALYHLDILDFLLSSFCCGLEINEVHVYRFVALRIIAVCWFVIQTFLCDEFSFYVVSILFVFTFKKNTASYRSERSSRERREVFHQFGEKPRTGLF